MGYVCKDDSLKKLKRYQRQAKRKKITKEGCDNSHCIFPVTCSSPLLQSDDSATPPICAATSTVSSSTPSLFSHLSSNILTLASNVDPQVDNVSDCVYETDETKFCNCEEEIKRLKAEIECLKNKVTSLEKTAIYFNQESVRLSQENTALRNKVEKNIFSVRNLDEKKLKFFTGKVFAVLLFSWLPDSKCFQYKKILSGMSNFQN